jgi:cell wall-associated NlpC family hydrolase
MTPRYNTTNFIKRSRLLFALKRLTIITMLLLVPFGLEAAEKLHIVKKGDTLATIAKRYHTSVKRLCRINGISPSSPIRIGQKLKLASSKKDTTRTTAKRKSKKNDKHLARVIIRSSHDRYKSQKRQPRSPKTLSDIVFGSLRYDVNSLTPKSQRIIELAKKELGKRYVWGATGKNAFDCSGLTSYVCKLNGIKLPRRAIEQSKVGLYVPRDQLQPGDLVFFDTSKQRRGYVNHVGIYIGNGKFIHASSAKKKVIITSLDKPFYKSRYKGARRVVASL